MSGKAPKVLAGALLLSVHAASGFAQGNQLANPGFASDLSGWTASAFASVMWDPLDADGALDSGSAFVLYDVPGGTRVQALFQCLPVTEGIEYTFRADLFGEDDPGNEGIPGFQVNWYDDGACSSFVGVSAFQPAAFANGEWIRLVAADTAPSGAVAGRFALAIEKPGAAMGSAYFDNAGFALELIFSDGFEAPPPP